MSRSSYRHLIVLSFSQALLSEARRRSAACSTQHKRLVKMCEAPFALRSARASTHPASDCAARLPALAAQLPPHRKNRRFFLRRLSCVTHYTLPARWWASRSLWTPLKTPPRRVMLRHHPPLSAFGKDQNHTEPCFTDRIASCAFAFFAVLSPMPASRSIAKTSR